MRKAKINFEDIMKMKAKEKIFAITAYDAMFAKIFDEYADIILVSDTLNITFSNQKDVVSLTLDEMLYHAKAVKNAVNRAFVVADLPFGTYIDEKTVLENAVKLCKGSQVDAVKIESEMNKVSIIKALSDNGINVMVQIGSLSHHQNQKDEVKGKSEMHKKILLKEAKLIAAAGAFSIILDNVLPSLAKEISKSVDIPVLGLGSGEELDGELVIFSDMLGLSNIYKNKATKSYLHGDKLIKEALNSFSSSLKKEELLLIKKNPK